MDVPKIRSCVSLLAVLSTLAGCMSYGIPAKNILQQEQRIALAEDCVGVQIDVAPSDREWVREELQKLRKELASDLREVPGMRVIVAGSPRVKNKYQLTLHPTPSILNEPFLMVATLGLVPQPMSHYTGYKFSVSNEARGKLADVNATHMVNNWYGWFVSLFSLSSTQTLSEELAKVQNRAQARNETISQLYKLGVFEGCLAAK